MKTKKVVLSYEHCGKSYSMEGLIDYDNYLGMEMYIDNPEHTFVEIYVDEIRTYVNKSKITTIVETL